MCALLANSFLIGRLIVPVPCFRILAGARRRWSWPLRDGCEREHSRATCTAGAAAAARSGGRRDRQSASMWLAHGGLLQTGGRHVHRVTAAHSTDGGRHAQDPCVLLWLCPCSSPSGRGRAWLVHSCPIAAGHVRPCRSGPGPRRPIAVTAATWAFVHVNIPSIHPHSAHTTRPESQVETLLEALRAGRPTPGERRGDRRGNPWICFLSEFTSTDLEDSQKPKIGGNRELCRVPPRSSWNRIPVSSSNAPFSVVSAWVAPVL